ncbi:MAG: hypothetical protein ACP5QK_06545 [Myxococcota bacterium]
MLKNMFYRAVRERNKAIDLLKVMNNLFTSLERKSHHCGTVK